MSSVPCKPCSTEKSTKNHITHVLAYILRVYGSCNCLRTGCEEPAEYADSYCAEHHTEWIHAENARGFHNLSVDYIGKPKMLQQAKLKHIRTCSKCTKPAAHPTSSYCVEHRREYNKSRRDKLRLDVVRQLSSLGYLALKKLLSPSSISLWLTYIM